jgi:16S rRNA (adenine(1408)-N(1))-methyltransferase
VLYGLADSMTVHFPWASLLRGVLGHDDAVLAGLAQMLAPGAEATALVSVLPRDGVPGIPAAGALARDAARHGLELAALRPATAAEIAASASSWAKRLRAGRERSGDERAPRGSRPVTLLRFRRVTVDR